VDLSGVTYIDSSMIASLVQGLRHGKGKGLSVGLVGVRDSVLKVLKLSSLDKIFTMHDSVADALAAG
jgi:anti-sigma B factor antagonist